VVRCHPAAAGRAVTGQRGAVLGPVESRKKIMAGGDGGVPGVIDVNAWVKSRQAKGARRSVLPNKAR